MIKPLLLAAALLAGCGTSAGSDQTTVTVFAAASLTESFTALEKRFETDNPGVDLRLNFAGSSALAQQLANGAAADVFAAADEKTVAGVAEHLESPAVFATNRLTIAVPRGNPAKITGLADLTRTDVTVVVCAPQVPCGAATRKVAPNLRPASEEQDVKAVLTKVAAGEADAGLVYVTDTRSGKVDAIDFPESAAVVNKYPIALTKQAPNALLARRFVDLVLSQTGQNELVRAGFGKP
ncbi:molybdate transport system substrate-binding protein [Actinokineospora alba]|uniref:Molybdate transport system substrate-binding protein n=1 Tax=Actinokineospora alba TaxID=504798 RepID=A0A1H0SBL9_9PSEU|nr:molybdate transport system substrate-binding protein [Actinokineospora alba]SDI52719.1 molybdate transport system substrate-binding protein [Actinokineospora alba]SDP39182.1 molybdate transport system substrate-binding protein [Actinokineospora alba]